MKWTLQTLFQHHFPAYLATRRCTLAQRKAASSVMQCRTAVLGGHVQCCPEGHVQGVWYNSCRHRSCPQCNGLSTARWLEHTESVLLDCPHHHVIFTLPSELHALWQYNRALMTDLLFEAVQATLKTFSQDKRYLDAQPGVLMTLHTWGRDLSLHPHIHCLISHGGLSHQGNWVTPKKHILFPQKPLMQVYRGKLLALLRSAIDQGVLAGTNTPAKLRSSLNRLGRKDWIVHCCKRYEHGKGVAIYLARYVRGGPFSRQQLICAEAGRVRFRYQSHRTGQQEVANLPVETFIQRWLMHVPLPGKASIRYLGLYSSAARNRLNQARESLGQMPVTAGQLLQWQDYLAGIGRPACCEICGAPLYQQASLEKEVPRQTA